MHATESSKILMSIPGWPGYSIDQDGRVFSRYGVLEADAKGRFNLRGGGKSRRIAGVELLAMAKAAKTANMPQPEPKREEPEAGQTEPPRDEKTLAGLEAAKMRLSEMERKHRWQKKLNATLWIRLMRLEKKLASQGMGLEDKLTLAAGEQEEWRKMVTPRTDAENMRP